MNNKVEYEFYDGANTTSVDRVKQKITTYERGGWGRDYSLTFAELLENAKNWDVKVDLNDSDEVLAEIATNIILANNAASHNLDPFRFIPRSNKITDPRDKYVLSCFETLLDKYSLEQIIEALSEDKKEVLRKFSSEG